jgi:diguanylate cyclase (GGDEF)-like protein/PAS domain S-box-containing protein
MLNYAKIDRYPLLRLWFSIFGKNTMYNTRYYNEPRLFEIIYFMANLEKKIEELKAEIANLSKENLSLKHAKTRLEEHLAAALDRTGLYIWEQDVPSGQLKILNQTFGTMCGFEPNEIEASVASWKNNLHPDDKEQVIEAFRAHLAGETPYYHVTHRMLHKEGNDIWVSDRGRVIEYDNEGKPLRMMGTHIDITQEKLYEIELAQYANLDPLTNLLNRKAFQNSFESFTHSKDYFGGSLLFIDLDDFKSVNDMYGHNIGDALLQHISKILVKTLPKNSLIARFGGDEFAVICPETQKDSVEKIAKELLASLAQPLSFERNTITASLSIGICSFKRDDESFATIYDKADKALYSVKRKEKNNYAFHSISEKPNNT